MADPRPCGPVRRLDVRLRLDAPRERGLGFFPRMGALRRALGSGQFNARYDAPLVPLDWRAADLLEKGPVLVSVCSAVACALGRGRMVAVAPDKASDH